MQESLFDRAVLVALMVAGVLVVFLTLSNRGLRRENEALGARMTRLEEHRGALDAYEDTRSKWEEEKTAEQASRMSAESWRAEVSSQLDEVARLCSSRCPVRALK